ncbi:hypothetical protein AVEN_102807-1, partial [Araneus ventricosus]
MGAVFTSEIVSDANAIDPIGVQFTEEKRDSETVQSTASNGTEQCEKPGKWSELPSLPLEKIYSFLRREDQVNMSLVCRSWSEGYGSPSVWKSFRFYLTESQLTNDTCPVMEVVKKYSSMFRHVEIVGSCAQNCFMKNFFRHFMEFLQILTRNSQLNSVEFRSISLCLIHMNNPPYYEICRAIADFLSSQRHLKRVEFHYCFFRYQETVEILRNVIENSRKTITHLKLRGFSFHENEYIEYYSNAAQKLPILADLPHLKTLDTDYSFIFENMVSRQCTPIQIGKNCQTLVFTTLILEYDNSLQEINEFRGLTSEDWRFMKKMCPDLQVELILKIGEPSRRELEFFIVPNMPITRLDYKCEVSDIEIVVLFDHLLACKTNEHLVYLKLEWEETTQHLSSTFILFLQACKKLKCLVLIIYSPISGLDVLL